MNTNLLMALACFQRGLNYVLEAERELYLNNLISENENAIMRIQAAIDACEETFAGASDDITSEYMGLNKKPIIETKNKYIGVVKRKFGYVEIIKYAD